MLTQLTFFLYIVIFLYGIVIGSFLNVLIFRIPKKENIVQSSHCMNCGRKLGWRDMVPVFSYIILRGRCRQCGARISIQYPLIEALNGVLYVVVFMAGGFTFSSVLYCLMTSAWLSLRSSMREPIRYRFPRTCFWDCSVSSWPCMISGISCPISSGQSLSACFCMACIISPPAKQSVGETSNSWHMQACS